MKRINIITALVSLLVVALVHMGNYWGLRDPDAQVMKVGFIYEDDESTPYTYNFVLAQENLESLYGDRIKVLTRNNVPATEVREPVFELVKRGCSIIFTNCLGTEFLEQASLYPQVQFCQISSHETAGHPYPENYHTFNGAIYEGRYVSGVAAGMKLQELIEEGEITPEQALVGFIGTEQIPEVVSGFTAFLLGVRQVVPQARMKVIYTGTLNNFPLEKQAAVRLIKEGCVVISQYCATIGPALACEEMAQDHTVIHVGYHQSLIGVAPTTALISTKVNWTPYVIQAVEAVRRKKPIESLVPGRVIGNDVLAGFSEDGVQMMELNPAVAAPGTQEAITDLIEQFRSGTIQVFQGDYIGINPRDMWDVINLAGGYQENADSSVPSFFYILQDVIENEGKIY